VIWVLACWGVAADGLVARGRRPTASTPVPAPASDGSAGTLSPTADRPDAPLASAAAGPRWGIASVALLLAGLARSETWLLLPVPVLFGLLAWRRGDRRGLLLLLALLAPGLWLLHDELLSGSALFSMHVPSAYTDAHPPGRRVIPLQRWVRRFLRSYSHDRAATLMTTSAALGAVFLLLRRRAVGLVLAAGALFVGVWALLGRYAAEGVYISPASSCYPTSPCAAWPCSAWPCRWTCYSAASGRSAASCGSALLGCPSSSGPWRSPFFCGRSHPPMMLTAWPGRTAPAAARSQKRRCRHLVRSPTRMEPSY
jgi:hypothetical protein